MSDDADTSTTKTQANKSQEFSDRHAKELGVGKFAKVQAIYTFVPLLAAAAGGAIGYYLLAKPATKLFPKISKAAGIAEVATGKVGRALKVFFGSKDVEEGLQKLSQEQAEFAASHGSSLMEVWHSDLGLQAKFEKAVEILKLELPEVPKTFRLGSAVVAGTVGMTGGGIAIGYDKWRKEESARLAAQEINHDIANLELFKPSDPELLAENKRLSSMVAALPVIDTDSAEQHGRVDDKQHSMVK